MIEILLIKTPDWELRVFSNGVAKSQKQLRQTLKLRGKTLPMSSVDLSTALKVEEMAEMGLAYCPLGESHQTLALSQLLFFENTNYRFEWVFTEHQTGLEVLHKLQNINEAFYFDSRYGVHRLAGQFNMNNLIGWLRLPIRYLAGGKTCELTLSFEVWPTKMDMTTDLDRMYLDIDELYPLWRFALAEKTEQQFQRSGVQESHFGLLWLAQFESLRDSLQWSINRILNSPHNRLQPVKRSVRAEQFKGKIPPKREEQIRTAQQSGGADKRFQMIQKHLDVDTPENRFVKMVLATTLDKLTRFFKSAHSYNQSMTSPRLSETFFRRLSEWRKPLEKHRDHPLFKAVGVFTRMSNESLVLQRKDGYAQVYRIWHLLSLHLETLGSGASISMKPVSKIYEIWCFLSIKQVLLSLGFFEVTTPLNRVSSGELELHSQAGYSGTFELMRDDGINIRLAHQPKFNEKSSPVRTWNTTQIPDILMEVEFAGGDVLYWVFDAKYRINSEIKPDGKERIPEDAINQMYRYRDALFHLIEDEQPANKSRAIYGAYALYPGFFTNQTADNCDENPFAEGNGQTGVGAFPLLPGPGGIDEKNENVWFRTFLTDIFGEDPSAGTIASADRQYIDKSYRIPNKGYDLIHYRDLCLIATSAEDQRDDGYYQQFEGGTATWFHMKLLATERDIIEEWVMEEVRYCAIASAVPGEGDRKVCWLWPVRSISKKARRELTPLQTGKASSQSNELYWLFELDSPIALDAQIGGFVPGHHHMKLTRRSELVDIEHFDDVIVRYPGIG